MFNLKPLDNSNAKNIRENCCCSATEVSCLEVKLAIVTDVCGTSAPTRLIPSLWGNFSLVNLFWVASYGTSKSRLQGKRLHLFVYSNYNINDDNINNNNDTFQAEIRRRFISQLEFHIEVVNNLHNVQCCGSQEVNEWKFVVSTEFTANRNYWITAGHQRFFFHSPAEASIKWLPRSSLYLDGRMGRRNSSDTLIL